MTQQQTTGRPSSGPDPLSTYQAGYQNVADIYGHFLRGLVDANAESYRFVTRRLEDDFQWPAALAQCRNPVEFMEVQGRFLEKMFTDYLEEGRRMLELAGDTARIEAHDLDEAASLGAHAAEEAALSVGRTADAVAARAEHSAATLSGEEESRPSRRATRPAKGTDGA